MSQTGQYETMALEVEGHFARIEFRRPDQHNAFNADMHREFPKVLAEVRQLQDIRILLLKAQGKAFVGGGDFDYMRQHVSLLTEVQSLMSEDLEEALQAAAQKRPATFRNR